MKRIYTKVFLITAVFLLTNGIKAQAQQQDPYYPLLMAELTVSGGDTLPDGYISLSDSTLFDTHLMLSLYDTADISKIHVVLKKNEDGGNLLVQSFDFNTVQRNEYLIDLGLGSFRGMLRCYGEAVIEKTDGTLTDVFKVWK